MFRLLSNINPRPLFRAEFHGCPSHLIDRVMFMGLRSIRNGDEVRLTLPPPLCEVFGSKTGPSHELQGS